MFRLRRLLPPYFAAWCFPLWTSSSVYTSLYALAADPSPSPRRIFSHSQPRPTLLLFIRGSFFSPIVTHTFFYIHPFTPHFVLPISCMASSQSGSSQRYIFLLFPSSTSHHSPYHPVYCSLPMISLRLLFFSASGCSFVPSPSPMIARTNVSSTALCYRSTLIMLVGTWRVNG